jgi:peptide deformylase
MSDIVTVPHPVLRQVAKPIEKIDKHLLDIISDMTKALLSARDPEGIGLAAPQIGLPLRLFLARPDMKKPPLIFINPEIIKFSQRLQFPESKKGVYEGCLSIPHHYSPIKRSMSVTVKYQTIDFRGAGLEKPLQSERTQPDAGNDQAASTRDWSGEPKLVIKTETFSGLMAHIIQHETDHLNGILFVDHVLAQNSKLYLIKGEVCEEISL